MDYSNTSGKTTRWTDGRGMDFGYADMSANDRKALTYTTQPLETDMEVTGHPVVTLWVSSSASDGDFFVYLEEVDEKGYSHYLTEGVLRASHRKLSSPPFKYIGLPYHRSYAEDIEPIPEGEPVELVFDLHPTSNIFNTGHRIRIAVTCADQNNFDTPELSPPPVVTVYRNNTYASCISLPVNYEQEEMEHNGLSLLVIVIILLGFILIVIFLTMFMKSRRE